MTADADPVSGTLVFSTDSRTVVAEASERRDARGSAADARGGRCRRPAPRCSTSRRSTSRRARTAASSSTSAPRRVRFEEAVRRLEPLPDVLPDGPEALIPVFADTGSSRPRPAWGDADASARPAAVLVLVFPDEDGDARLVLTERVDRGGHHSGEVSFPGGSAEAGDADLVATALREAAEEVGLDPVQAGVRVLGVLEMQWIPVSNFTVTPVVAVADRRPLLTPQPTEVALDPRAAGGGVPARRRAADRRARDPRLAAALRGVPGGRAQRVGDDGPRARRPRRLARAGRDPDEPALERLAFLGVRGRWRAARA